MGFNTSNQIGYLFILTNREWGVHDNPILKGFGSNFLHKYDILTIVSYFSALYKFTRMKRMKIIEK